MNKYNIILLFVLACLLPIKTFAADFNSNEFCDRIKTYRESISSDFGKMTDTYTRIDGIDITCDKKIINFDKFMFANQSDLRDGWQGRKATQWNAIYCKDVWLDAINDGWTVSFTLTTQDKKVFVYKATCT